MNGCACGDVWEMSVVCGEVWRMSGMRVGKYG